MCAANIFDEMAGIAAPALVIAGENDSTTPQENCRSIAEVVPGSRFYTIEGTGHVITMEAPERLNACPGEFLTGIG